MSDTAAMYAAFRAKDSRFDGRFFVGITTTRIYCRPICTARPASQKNCHFFRSAAQAETQGFRPCLLCRPELAPGQATVDSQGDLARQAARLLTERASSPVSVVQLSDELGLSARHLRRVFSLEYGTSPREYLQTCRLLMAKALLADTGLPVIEVARTAGFGSLRQFNEVFRKRYRMTPTAMRKKRQSESGAEDAVTLRLGYRPPYRGEQILAFLAGRAIGGVELVERGAYSRSVYILAPDGVEHRGWLRVSDNSSTNSLLVTVSRTLLPVLSQVMTRVRNLFDVDSDPASIQEALAGMNQVVPGSFLPGVRVPGCFDAFEMAVRAVLGQQISVSAATTLAKRLVERMGTPMKSFTEGITHFFPTAAQVAHDPEQSRSRLGGLGITVRRADTIVELARRIADGALSLDPRADPVAARAALMDIPGIGPWTADYIVMRALGWPDVFLGDDAAVRKALSPRSKGEILQLSQQWSPWRSYATVGIWNSL